MGQHGISALLKQMDRDAILIGEGTGSIVAWLANDIHPEKVAAVVAVEPTGPPFGKLAKAENGKCTGSVQRDKSIRPYGIADIPLSYEPPVHFSDELQGADAQEPLDVVEVTKPGTEIVYYMQAGPRPGGLVLARDDNENPSTGMARELVNIKQSYHALVTAEASPHSQYDWMTSSFMKQAGVRLDWIKLEEHQIRGNGHLMFLEKNSNQVAALIERWIRLRMDPPPTSSDVDTPTKASAPSHRQSMSQHSVASYHAAMSQKMHRGPAVNVSCATAPTNHKLT